MTIMDYDNKQYLYTVYHSLSNIPDSLYALYYYCTSPADSYALKHYNYKKYFVNGYPFTAPWSEQHQ